MLQQGGHTWTRTWTRVQDITWLHEEQSPYYVSVWCILTNSTALLHILILLLISLFSVKTLLLTYTLLHSEFLSSLSWYQGTERIGADRGEALPKGFKLIKNEVGFEP